MAVNGSGAIEVAHLTGLSPGWLRAGPLSPRHPPLSSPSLGQEGWLRRRGWRWLDGQGLGGCTGRACVASSVGAETCFLNGSGGNAEAQPGPPGRPWPSPSCLLLPVADPLLGQRLVAPATEARGQRRPSRNSWGLPSPEIGLGQLPAAQAAPALDRCPRSERQTVWEVGTKALGKPGCQWPCEQQLGGASSEADGQPWGECKPSVRHHRFR